MALPEIISGRIQEAFQEAQRRNLLPPAPMQEGYVERPANSLHGDFSTSLPLKLARVLGKNPMEIAEILSPLFDLGEEFERVETALPGFINFYLHPRWVCEQVDSILQAPRDFCGSTIGRDQSVQVEFVSVNPTGPLHVGAARWAILGSTLANILESSGYNVTREYYINDAGNQMELFYRSLLARYRQSFGLTEDLPSDGYQGDYVVKLADSARSHWGDHFLNVSNTEALAELGAWGLTYMLKSIAEDLKLIGVEFDSWFSEKSLFDDSTYSTVMDVLAQNGHLVNREGATWFMSTDVDDDKESVLVRSNGSPTYFASDIAYHYNKFVVRNFDHVIDIWGADHQGHVHRMKAAIAALGIDGARFQIIIGQLVSLKAGGDIVRASKRTGQLLTLRGLVDEVGADACRYFFLARSPEAQMEFDMDLATQQSHENPVYYIKYAHARVAGILRHADELGISIEKGQVDSLTSPEELNLIRTILILPELLESMARSRTPHHLPHYALQLATAFHWFYDRQRVISEDIVITRARLKLVQASQIALAYCLKTMGMDTPERM